MKNFDTKNLRSLRFLIESSQAPKIKGGASSSSNILNRFFEAVSEDMSTLNTRVNTLVDIEEHFGSIAEAQGGAMSSILGALVARVDAASGYTEVLASMHTATYLDTSDADVSYLYGQATLPVTDRTDLLVQSGIGGTQYVSPEIRLLWATGAAPSELDFSEDPDGVETIKGTQPWVRPATTSTVWVILNAPLQYRGYLPNVLEFTPLPCFGLDVVSVEYQGAGESLTSDWHALDLSYVTGYDPATTRVEMAGPIRLHLDNVPISRIRIKMIPTSSMPWGLFRIGLYNQQYELTGELVVQDPYDRTVGDVTIRGKDTADLAQLTVTTNLNTATVNLSTDNVNETPVITGVIMAVS